jgi:hypothetical protein
MKVLSKQVVAENTRTAMSPVLKKLGGAQSLLRCTIWKTSDEQSAYQQYLIDAQAYSQNPIGSEPTFNEPSSDCLEYYETGYVLQQALPNSVCWYQDSTIGDTDTIDFSQPFTVGCLFRGGSGYANNYVNGTDVGFTTTPRKMPCSEALNSATDENTLYYAQCQSNKGSGSYFTTPDASVSTYTLVDKSIRPLIDLANGVTGTSLVHKNLFTYTKINGGTPSYDATIPGADTTDIEHVDVNLDVLYKTGGYTNGKEDVRTYRFGESVLLQGVEAYVNQGAYADRFTGG